ncbi:hypothetical protein [Caudovirales GX15bay]|nr:hypothetical protein [Caudovirales GX15bay]
MTEVRVTRGHAITASTPVPRTIGATAGLPPIVVLAATTLVADTQMVQPPTADAWYQSEGIDDYVTVETRNSGHEITVLRGCTMEFVVHADLSLNSNSAGNGESGQLGVGMDVYGLSGVGDIDMGASGATGTGGFYRRTAFPALAQTTVGISCTRTYRFSGNAVWSVGPHLFNELGYDRTFYWKITAKVFADTYERTLEDPGI